MPSRCSWKAQPASCTLNLKLTLAYDGTRYWGWQKADPHPTIEGTLGEAIARLLNRPVQLQAASRTDRGVHAEGQVVNFIADEWKNPFLKEGDSSSVKGGRSTAPEEKLVSSANPPLQGWDCAASMPFDPRELLLPPDIVLRDISVADPDFHPTLDAKGKIYTYDVSLGYFQLPFHRARSGHYRNPVSLEKMRAAAQHLLGQHDFSSFAGEPSPNPICHLQSITIEEISEQRLRLTFFGDRFLFRMVRILVGTLLNVGSGMIPPTDIPAILESRDRSRAGLTAPAMGLTLKQVFY